MTQDEIIKFAKQAGFTNTNNSPVLFHGTYAIVLKFAKIIEEQVKEQCVQTCEDHFSSDGHWIASQIRRKNDN